MTLNQQKTASGPKWQSPARQQEVREKWIQQLLAMSALAAGGGMGLRGLQGLLHLDPSGPAAKPSAALPQSMSPILPEAEDEQNIRKTAAEGEATPGIVSQLASSLPFNIDTTDPRLHQYTLPLSALAVGASGYGGYKLLDKLLGSQKKRTQEQELAAAEKKYREALAQQYQAAMMPKAASAIDQLSQQYEQIREQYHKKLAEVQETETTEPAEKEKQAFVPLSALPFVDKAYGSSLPLGLGHDGWSLFKGVSNTALLASLLGGGAYGYSHAGKRNQEELLAKAIRQRQRQRNAQLSPPPIYASLPSPKESKKESQDD